MRALWITVIVLALLLPSVATAQDDSDCDPLDLNGELKILLEQLDGATYEDVVSIAVDIDNAVSAYLTECNPGAETFTADPDFETFTVGISESAPVRVCASVECDVLFVASLGESYTVIGEQDSWFVLELAGNVTGYIASFATIGAPPPVFEVDGTVDIYETNVSQELNCAFVAEVSRSSSDSLDILLAGERQDDMIADIFRPGIATPEPVRRQNLRTFADTGNFFIQQTYQSRTWQLGTYRLQIQLDGTTRTFAFDLTQRGDTTIQIHCN